MQVTTTSNFVAPQVNTVQQEYFANAPDNKQGKSKI